MEFLLSLLKNKPSTGNLQTASKKTKSFYDTNREFEENTANEQLIESQSQTQSQGEANCLQAPTSQFQVQDNHKTPDIPISTSTLDMIKNAQESGTDKYLITINKHKKRMLIPL